MNYQSTPSNSILEKMRFLFCFIFNDLQSLKTAANFHKNWPYAAATLNESELPNDIPFDPGLFHNSAR